MKPDTTHIIDPDGREVVAVRLSNAPGKTASVYREDFARIVQTYPGNWSLVDASKPISYVRVKGKNGRSIYPARLVSEAPTGTAIGYFDDNPLNLRKGNLSYRTGAGGRPRRAWGLSPSSPIPG